ncbi:MAG: oxidoreductase [Acidimicrobiaceae bacterium]|nr:oxidoreductase [Acidimicrobiaceae bacterium]
MHVIGYECKTELVTQSIFDAAGGSKALLDLAKAWHARCLADPVVSHAFSQEFHADHCERLAAYWGEALGGPSDYSASMGDESSVIRMHSGMGEHVEMDESAQACFDLALDDAQLPLDPQLSATLADYFRWATGTLSMYPDSADDVASGLSIAKWSWAGPA